MVALLNKLMILLVTLACLGAASGDAVSAAERGKRGDYPRCQEICLDTHTKRMTQASEGYGRSGNKLLYQEQVEDALLGYSRCIDNCKELIPVK